jgi:hypothetical protein
VADAGFGCADLYHCRDIDQADDEGIVVINH